MPSVNDPVNRPRILVAGGGYVGLYVALRLQKKVAAAGGIVTVVDPMPYMTYRPFLPEVAGGNLEGRHVTVPLHRTLRKAEFIQGSVVAVDHSGRRATVQLPGNEGTIEVRYVDIVMAAGATTRIFPIPGLAEKSVGIRTLEEAVALRSQVLERIEFASTAVDPAMRETALTFVVVGGGIGGIETLTEIEDLARSAIVTSASVKQEEARFVLVEAMARIMPEVTAEQAKWVVEHLRSRGIEVLLNTSLASVEGSTLKLISLPGRTPAQELEADTLIWTAGAQPNPVVRSTDLPFEPRGRVRVLPDLRVAGDEGIVENAWAAGDIAAVPDLTGNGLPDGTCVPNAQHALRQAKLLARNLWASRRGYPLQDYKHKNLGVVAGFGRWKGVANINLVGHIGLTGPLAWLTHRGYHGLAIPTMESKALVGLNLVSILLAGRATNARRPR
ncbi:NAD(P)/FAD-dependent oxidoreductase [Pseudarthrobacter sp. NPDC058362]|uniref:NAD(P)/FAD-dependent oxidoreductase n=1 Tax=Pseudarthrobacter sp. NPDC058362 TaxID=3346458 RepID=UPI00365BDF08